MSTERPQPGLSMPVVYDRDAVLTKEQVAAGLGVTVRDVTTGHTKRHTIPHTVRVAVPAFCSCPEKSAFPKVAG